jgi:hypothetical protein
LSKDITVRITDEQQAVIDELRAQHPESEFYIDVDSGLDPSESSFENVFVLINSHGAPHRGMISFNIETDGTYTRVAATTVVW